MRRTRAGFTLLEILVAIAIFASLALMAQQVTNGVARVNSAVADHDQKLNLMQQTMSFLTHDLTQIMPRPVRSDQGSVNQRYWLALACWRLRVEECVLCAAVWLTR